MTDDQRAAEAFLDHYRIVPRAVGRDLIVELGSAFGHLPYENLTKLIKKHGNLPVEQSEYCGPELILLGS